MRIRMLTLMAGPQGVWQPGSVLEVGPVAARVLVEGGYAVAVDAVAVVPAAPMVQETAALAVPETPERAVPKRRKG